MTDEAFESRIAQRNESDIQAEKERDLFKRRRYVEEKLNSFDRQLKKIIELKGEGGDELKSSLHSIELALDDIGATNKHIADNYRTTLQSAIERCLPDFVALPGHIRNDLRKSSYHSARRTLSHFLFDRYLGKCKRGECPSFKGKEVLVKFLASISLEGHTLRMARFYHACGCLDADANYYGARNDVHTVLDCETSLPDDSPLIRLLDLDSEQVMGKNWHAARKRKAYLIFLMEGQQHGGHERHYRTADSFIRKLHRLAVSTTEAKKLLDTCYYMANPLDLYRFCEIRRKSQHNLKALSPNCVVQ
ncbi:MAG: hypothetical protein HY913_16550 [Desulfomonile tiedjei]|nr:hypothetical protein [Desulfomonile tiedjei]